MTETAKAPKCKRCGKPCQKYALGYSVQCKACNEHSGVLRRASYARNHPPKPTKEMVRVAEEMLEFSKKSSKESLGDLQKGIEAMTIQMDLRGESMRAQFNYRTRAVEELLQRIEDCCQMATKEGYKPEIALSMIEKQCRRIRMIDAELKK